MIRQGLLCLHCNGSCRDAGTEAEPIEITCTNCEGGGCEHCTDGNMKIVGCPNAYCGKEIAEVTKLADLFDKGLPPIAGGALDQAASFLNAVHVLRRDEALARNAE